MDGLQWRFDESESRIVGVSLPAPNWEQLYCLIDDLFVTALFLCLSNWSSNQTSEEAVFHRAGRELAVEM